MEDRDYRSEVGKKIEEALAMGDFDLVEDLIEVPPMETFMQWAEKGEEKRKKRIRRKKILVSCIAVVVVSASVLIGLKCFALPEVTADPEDDVTIDMSDMESIETYSSWDALPIEIKKQFIEVKDLPEGYVVEEIEINKCTLAATLEFLIKEDSEYFRIRQYVNTNGGLPTSTVAKDNQDLLIAGITVYVEHSKQYKTTTYKYLTGNIVVDVIVPINTSIETIEKIIKTVQK